MVARLSDFVHQKSGESEKRSTKRPGIGKLVAVIVSSLLNIALGKACVRTVAGVMTVQTASRLFPAARMAIAK